MHGSHAYACMAVPHTASKADKSLHKHHDTIFINSIKKQEASLMAVSSFPSAGRLQSDAAMAPEKLRQTNNTSAANKHRVRKRIRSLDEPTLAGPYAVGPGHLAQTVIFHRTCIQGAMLVLVGTGTSADITDKLHSALVIMTSPWPWGPSSSYRFACDHGI